MTHDRRVMDDGDINRALARIAHEIVEAHKGVAGLVIAGIRTRGVPLAKRLVEQLAQIEPTPVEEGELDITLYRDDLRRHPTREPGVTRMPDIEGKVVVLVDDVLYSGRTVAAALDALSDLGRPRAVRLVALVDRGHRQLPVRADFVGREVPTASRERVTVRLTEVDGVSDVTISKEED